MSLIPTRNRRPAQDPHATDADRPSSLSASTATIAGLSELGQQLGIGKFLLMGEHRDYVARFFAFVEYREEKKGKRSAQDYNEIKRGLGKSCNGWKWLELLIDRSFVSGDGLV
jgi:hypothetical protein